MTHLIDGEFQSDKYPTTPRGKVPLSVRDASAQDLLWAYAQRRRVVDVEFSDDLETALKSAGYVPREPTDLDALEAIVNAMTPGEWAEDDCNVFSRPLSEARARAIVAKIQGEPFDPAHVTFDAFIASTEQRHGQQSDDDATGIVALHNGATALISELRTARAEVERLKAALRTIRGRAVEIRNDYQHGARHQHEASSKGAPLRQVDVGRSVGGPINVCLLWIDSVNAHLSPEELARSNAENAARSGE